ncbi:MAG: triose-phosphate isomerase [Mycobacteriales bacterium]
MMAGNWKMNCTHLEAIALVQKLAFSLSDQQLADVETVVVPPFTSLRSVQTLIDGDRLLLGYAAQDVSPNDSGAYTGDVGGPMLAALGCTYVLAGHSERRQYHAEDDEIVNSKVIAAYRNGLIPILCVGEGLEVRQAGGQVAHAVAQLRAGLAKVPAEQAMSAVLAYEPVWAIGTGEVATPADAQEVCGALRQCLAEMYSRDLAGGVRILYGGSVKSGNIAGIMAERDVDGALVGGASLDAEEFARICRYAETAD